MKTVRQLNEDLRPGSLVRTGLRNATSGTLEFESPASM